MNKFKKRYNDTFNSIHTPNSIKQEVLTMAKNLDNKQNDNQANDFITTEVEEVSKQSNLWRNVATAVAVVGICFTGVIFFGKSSNKIDVADIPTDTTTYNDLATDSAVSFDNSNFKDIFGFTIDELNPLEVSYTDTSSPLLHVYDNADVISNILNQFNTSSWQSTQVDSILESEPSNYTLNIIRDNDDNCLDVNFHVKDNQVYANVEYYSLETDYYSINSWYTIDKSTLDNLIQYMDSNNYLYFGVNPSNTLTVTLNGNTKKIISNKNTINNVQHQLFDNFEWNFSDDALANIDLAYFDIEFTQTYNNVEYNIGLLYYNDTNTNSSSIYCSMWIDTPYDNDNRYYSDAKLTSPNLEKSYQELLNAIQDESNTQAIQVITMNSTKSTTTAPQTTTEKVTTTATPKQTTVTTTTTPKQTTTEKITTTTPKQTTITTQVTTTPITTIEDTQITTETTKKTYSLATPQLSYAISMSNPDSLPQFLTSDQQQLMSNAYAIMQGFSFNSAFEYVQDDNIIYNNNMYSRIKSSEINTLQDVRQYFEQYFTDDFINTYINMDNFIEQNGHVYGINASRGGNIEYIGHSFVLDSQTEDRILFHANAYYQTPSDEMFTGNYFYNQEPTIPYETNICNYVLVKTDDGWRFDDFSVLL